MRLRSSSAITPLIDAAADTAARKPIATQNRGSVAHQPVIRSVAITAVPHPDTMLKTVVAIANLGSGAVGPRCGTALVAGSETG
ncbi:hypothetical protein MPRF_24980 [Mycolicibacterium parafortuitum]|uniref:Uncharacterized protein n=1 Tax=Mycolicibacterium parafortuitum TaxID=39692 RepID=A0A7I7U4U2_MYCPF|nr:hypothetical protein MPRF_24980 [Mycolicibacterium parafortuitum]